MKFLTLNTHSWQEEETIFKLQQIAHQIILGNYDVIALQEVNQLIQSVPVSPSELDYFCPVGVQPAVHADNFAYCLVQVLAEAGHHYYWSWALNHIGYDLYEEGNALLAKQPLNSFAHLVSNGASIQDYHTRKILLAQTTVADNQGSSQDIWVASCHFSWWAAVEPQVASQAENQKAVQESPLAKLTAASKTSYRQSESPVSHFKDEWQRLVQHLEQRHAPLYLLGDFNNAAGTPGYELVCNSGLVTDAYTLANARIGECTVDKAIDGWSSNREKLRIDYIFVPQNSRVKWYEVVFDGRWSPVVSDHFGIEVEVE
jgi:maltose 6'-phosphate phosphatase